MPEPVQGRCYCGRIRFEVSPPAKFVAHCHCTTCRHAHGAGAVTWAGFFDKQFAWTAGQEHVACYETETSATRSFCKSCGTTFLFESPRWAGEKHVAVACLSDPLDKLPDAHAYADRAPDWFPITDELACYGGENGNEPL